MIFIDRRIAATVYFLAPLKNRRERGYPTTTLLRVWSLDQKPGNTITYKDLAGHALVSSDSSMAFQHWICLISCHDISLLLCCPNYSSPPKAEAEAEAEADSRAFAISDAASCGEPRARLLSSFTRAILL